MIGEKLIHALRHGEKIVGIFIDSNFYPVISNHQNSIVAMLNTDGEVLWERSYTLKGKKSVVFAKDEKAKELEKLTLFSFAGLIEIPGVKEIYWSATRTYSPEVGEWLTLDNAVIWNPDSLLTKDGNWNPYVYAADDPVNFVDPSGYYTIFAGTGGGTGAGTGVRGSTGVWINKHPNKNWSPFSGGYYATTEIGGHYGMSAGAGAELGFVTGFRSDFEGYSTVHGGSGGFLGKFGADYTFTQSGAHGGSFSVEFGAGAAGYQRVGHTWAFNAAPDSLMGRAVDLANDFYNEHWGTAPSYFDYNSDNYSFGDWSFDTSL